MQKPMDKCLLMPKPWMTKTLSRQHQPQVKTCHSQHTVRKTLPAPGRRRSRRACRLRTMPCRLQTLPASLRTQALQKRCEHQCFALAHQSRTFQNQREFKASLPLQHLVEPLNTFLQALLPGSLLQASSAGAGSTANDGAQATSVSGSAEPIQC